MEIPNTYNTTEISKLIGVIAKMGHFVTTITTLNIYNSLILSHITYRMNVWGLTVKYHLNKILQLQKRVLRIMNFREYTLYAIPFFISTKCIIL